MFITVLNVTLCIHRKINSDSENLPAFKGKKLIKYVAVWRSEQFQDSHF